MDNADTNQQLPKYFDWQTSFEAAPSSSNTSTWLFLYYSSPFSTRVAKNSSGLNHLHSLGYGAPSGTSLSAKYILLLP